MMDRLRQQLDFNYHGMYSASRESLQHKIAESILNSDGLQLLRDNSLNKLTPSAQWMIMTAGPMGVGKSTVINWLASHGHLPFEVASCVSIDIDAIREILPESREMKEYQPEVYGSRTQKEAGLIAELAVLAALEAQKHVVVDSSMLSIKWQRDNILYLKDKHPGLKVLLLHVTAPEDIIHQRISRRQQRDGRIIPTEVLQKSIKLRLLAELWPITNIVDGTVSIDNSFSSPRIYYPWYLSWHNFHRVFGADALQSSESFQTSTSSVDSSDNSLYDSASNHSSGEIEELIIISNDSNHGRLSTGSSSHTWPDGSASLETTSESSDGTCSQRTKISSSSDNDHQSIKRIGEDSLITVGVSFNESSPIPCRQIDASLPPLKFAGDMIDLEGSNIINKKKVKYKKKYLLHEHNKIHAPKSPECVDQSKFEMVQSALIDSTLQNSSSTVPWMNLAGNHQRDYDLKLDCHEYSQVSDSSMHQGSTNSLDILYQERLSWSGMSAINRFLNSVDNDLRQPMGAAVLSSTANQAVSVNVIKTCVICSLDGFSPKSSFHRSECFLNK